MKKFLFVFISLCLIGQTYALQKGLNGDLHPKHRHLSEEGQINLSIAGRGYFQFRLRVKPTDSDSDSSQVVLTSGIYDQAYHAGNPATATTTGAIAAATSSSTDSERDTANTFTAAANGDTGFEGISQGDKIVVSAVSGKSCSRAGTYTVKSVTAGDTDTAATIVTNENQVEQVAGNECEIRKFTGPSSNTGRHHELDDKGDGTDSMETESNGAIGADGYPEAGHDGDSVYFSQVVYGKDGSLHVNRYGYLVDDNGLLLVSQGLNRNGQPLTTKNARFHIHIPSRADGIIVTPTGKVMAEELLGATYSIVGQIKLARFENPQGLNIRIKMKSNCMAANEDGFALGNWCQGSDLDGKDHVYMSETEVSGPGIVGNPGEQGFGRIVR
jgi:flagellar basal body rod protein FlgG